MTDPSSETVQQMMHEREVYQVELEAQNDELRRSKLELEASHACYHDLYRLAPAAFVSLNPQGLILEANLAAETLLGASRDALLMAPLAGFVAPEYRNLLHLYQKGLRSDGVTKSCELRMLGNDGAELWVRLQCSFTADTVGSPTYLAVLTDISDQKRNEQSLRESEEKYRTLHESMMDAYVRVDMEGRIIECNRSYMEMLGYGAEELSQLTYQDITPEKWHAMEGALVTGQILSRGYSDIYEKQYRRKDGSVFPVELRTLLIRDDGDTPVAMWAIVRDISKRQRAEQALQDANTLLTEFIRSSPTYSFVKVVKPGESRVLFASENYQEMIGIPGSDMLGKTMEELFPAELAAAMTTDDWNVVQNGKILTLDEELNGRFYTSIKFPIVQNDRVLLAGYSLDITERKRAEQAMLEWNKKLERRVAERTAELRRSESRFQLLAEATFEGVAITESGVLVDCNLRLAEIHGYEHAGMIGRSVMDFVAPESLSLVDEQLNLDGVATYEYWGLRKDGSVFPVESRARMMILHGRKARVTVLRDLTSVKQAESRILAQKAELEHAQRLAMVSEVSAGIIHQIGQPLSGIGVNIAAALAGTGGCNQQQCINLPILRDMESDVARIRDTVTQLRALANPGSSSRARFDFNSMVSEVLDLSRHEAERREITLSRDLAPTLPQMLGDSVQLSQVVLNLVRNALDACAECPPDRRRVVITTRLMDGVNLGLFVCDSGTGISPEVMDELFAPFFTTKSEGLGMGLRFSRTIIHAHGGTIEADNNTDGHGAVFRVLVPASQKPVSTKI